ncbi:MAG: PAS domain S-box protein, partial [Deltaproteobacteria bacterium]|nr:PAS domain S-box protein [Deltaproteobacteria bacterium]
MNILIVDDNEDSRIILKKALESGGHTVEAATDGQEALKVARKCRPDMIISDILMPVMDGFSLCREWMRDERLREVPFIFYTATYTDSKDEKLALNLGAHRFIVKPVEPDKFLKIIEGVIIDVKDGKKEPRKLALKKDKEVFKLYSERLVKKLEKKMLDLESEIAQHKQAEEALRESEEKYRLMFETMVSGFALLEMMYDESGKPMDCRYLEANPTHEKLTGLKTSEIIGRTARECIPGLEDSWIENYGQVDRTGKPMEVENYVEGLKSWYKVFAYSTKPGFVAVTFENITDRKRAEETLKTREQAIDSSINGINFTDLQGNFIYANNSFLKMWGFKTKDDLIGRDISDLWAASNRFQEALNEFQKKGSYVGELEAKKQDGTKFDVQLSATTVKGESGEPLFLMASFVDITQRNQAYKALRESEEKYRLLVENATDAIFIAQDEVSKFANPKTEEMTGYSAEELAKISFVDLIHPEDRDMVFERHLKRLKGEEIPSIYSFRILNRSGEELSVELNATPIIWEGRPATLNFLRDITPQKKMEAQLEQAQKMEALGTLAGGIAHDFNNLLMAIQSRTSIMLMKKDSSHPDIRHLKGIEDNVESAADLTRQLLGFARGGKYEVKPTDMNELIKKQNRMFGRTKKEITIRGKYEENPWSVEVDRGQIEQVLLNLYINAWQAMPGGGNLNLETENVTLDENHVKPFSIEPGRYVKISVTDTGAGMDKATRKRIFEPFFTTKEMGRGTGLGLASVYGIIKNHGGFINVYSEKGHGTIFNIYLPATGAEGMVQRVERKGEDKIIRGKETVLFVDDEDMIIEIAEELFEQLGYKVLIARSGREAIETYDKNKDHIDIVLLDMIMPDMSGSDTYDRMKKIDPDIKVLLFSGYSIDGQATKILDRGCNGFIQKPFKMKELSQK